MNLRRQRNAERENRRNSGRARLNRDPAPRVVRTVQQRAPTAADDYAAGYPLFSEWIEEGVGIYRCVGDGVWV